MTQPKFSDSSLPSPVNKKMNGPLDDADSGRLKLDNYVENQPMKNFGNFLPILLAFIYQTLWKYNILQAILPVKSKIFI